MIWLRKNWLSILIPVVGILAITDIYLRYNPSWSFTIRESTIFNNIATPVATIVSIGIYAWTLVILIQQNRIAHSNNLKPYFERRFDFVLNKLNERSIKYRYYTDLFNSFEILDIIYNDLREVAGNGGYLMDLQNYKSNFSLRVKDIESYNTYIGNYVDHLYPFCNYGIPRFNLVSSLVEQLNESDLMEMDKVNFKEQIKTEMIEPYIKFIGRILIVKDQFLIPFIYEADENDIVPWKPIIQTKISNHYDFFLKELYNERLQD
jgi:hypothetical protein